MPKLIISENNRKIGEVALEYGTLTLGRKGDNDIQIDDQAVSAHHAKIVTFHKPSYLEDLRSTNGTFVNGQRIKVPHTLQHGDTITIGKHHLFFDKESDIDSSGDPDLTQIISADEQQQILQTINKAGTTD